MKIFWLLALLAAGIGTAVAWTINQNRYGYRDAMFGPFEIGGEVTPANVAQHVKMSSGKLDETVGKVAIDGDLEYDFGVMSPGEEGEHVFMVRNVGEGKLRLRVGASTCKCTMGELNKSILGPGEETEIKLSWTVQPGTSEFGQSAQLLTNDPAMVAITLKITGKIIEDFQLVPQVWTFGEAASGEPFEVSGTIYNFMKTKISPGEPRFTSDVMNDLAEFDVQPLDKSEYVTGNENAVQAFRVTARIKSGMPQGNISQNLLLPFDSLNKNGEVVGFAGQNSADEAGDDKPTDAQKPVVVVPIKGRVVGTLRMLESSKLTVADGQYVYDFGRIGPDDSFTAKTFVVLKGEQRDNTTLTVGDTAPNGVVRAKLGEPKGRGSMVLYPLEIELVPASEPIARLGKDGGDYGSIWIESDNPKVSRMRVILKFAIDGR